MSDTRLQTLKREMQFRRWRDDARSFMEEACYIWHPLGKRLLELRDAQSETLDAFLTQRQILILKARQIGFSTLVCAYVLWLTLFRPEQKVILLSRREDDAEALLAMVKYAYERLPEWVRERAPAMVTNTLSEIAFANESVIESHPSKSNPARGRTVNLIVADEWAFFENAEDAWASLEPTADIGGQIIALSTANGWGNLFHRMWNATRAGLNDFHPIFYSWRAVPERDDEWYRSKLESAKAQQTAHKFHQEYPNSETEAFILSGNMVFDPDLLKAIETNDGETGYLLRGPGIFEFRQQPRGAITVWKLPLPGHRYVIGADTAEGLEHGDYSSAHVIDVDTGEVVATWHGHEDPDAFGDQLILLGRFYNRALIGVEVNSSGLTTAKTLQRNSYPRIYYRRTLDDQNRNRVTTKLGWRTTSSSKPLMIDDLNKALREGELTVYCEFTVAELTQFVRDEKGKMGGSPFDDRVISLAIAQQMRQHAGSPEYLAAEGPPPGTLGWELEQLEGGRAEEFLIGAHNTRR
jgi:hypothetical protein